MDFKTKAGRVITVAEAIGFLRTFPLCSKNILSSLPPGPDPPVGKDVTYMIAYNTWYLRGEELIEAANSHPVKHVEVVSSFHPMTIYPYTMTYRKEGVDVVDTVRRGYVCPLTASPKVMIAAHVSDVAAYLYTEPAKKDIVTETTYLESNFTKEKCHIKSYLPVASAVLVTPKGWVKGKAATNRDKIYRALDDNSQLVALQGHLHDVLYDVNFQRSKVAVTRDVITTVDFPGYTKRENDRMTTKALTPFVPNCVNFPTWDGAYKFLHTNRVLRGEDKKWISPLTVGYYWASIPSSLNKYLWILADIMHVVRLRKVPAVYFTYEPNACVIYSLIHTGVTVFVQTTGVPTDLIYDKSGEKDVLRIGQYLVREPPRLIALTILSPKLSVKPTVLKKGLDYGDLKKSNEIIVNMAKQATGPIFAHVFLSPELFDFIAVNPQLKLIPSIHAHAGSVILTTTYRDDHPYEQQMLMRRMCHANSVKTWFPISRYRFLEHDFGQWGFENIGINQGLILSLTPLMKEAVSMYDEAVMANQVTLHEELPEIANSVRQFYASIGINVVAKPAVELPEIEAPPREQKDVIPDLVDKQVVYEDDGADDNELDQDELYGEVEF